MEVVPYSILIQFNTGEVRKLDIEKALGDRKGNTYVQRILQADIFPTVKIGDVGQILWENCAVIKNLDGQIEPCEYDFSPEFVYYSSILQ